MSNVGTVVLYRLTDTDIADVNQRRDDAENYGAGRYGTGYIFHVGTRLEPAVSEDDVNDAFPLLVVVSESVDGNDVVSGQVFLPGNDTLFVEGVSFGDDAGQYDFVSE